MGSKSRFTRLFLAILLILAGLNGAGQMVRINHLTTFDDKLLHFGFTLGINTLDFGVRNYTTMRENPSYTPVMGVNPLVGYDSTLTADVAGLIPGFTVAMVANLRLTRSLDLRFLPGMSFGERKLRYNIPVFDEASKNPLDPQEDYSLKSTFIDFPVLIKYKANRINNGRPYVVFGGAMRIDISKSATTDLVGLTRGGYYAEMGAGWDSYLQFFRLSVEAKVSLGLNNQLGKGPGGDTSQRTYYTDALKSLQSNVFTLSFHFE